MAFEKNMGENSKQVHSDEDSNYIPKTISDILKKLSSISDFANKSSELDFHLRSYEKELRKVDAFKRELPLCMQLLKDGIEKLEEERLQYCKERETEPVMEEFVLRKSNSDGDGRAKMSIELSEKKTWMSSAQLWNTPVQYENNFHTQNEESFLSLKSSYQKDEARGGAFVPFKKPSGVTIKDYDDQRAVPVEGLSLSEAEPIDVRVHESRGLVSARPQQPHQQQPQRKQRRCWSPELHKLFVDALDNLGGAEVATPKQIREQMKVEGLTNDEVKSHLQKYRIHIRRLASSSAEPSGLPWFTQANQMAANVGSSQEHHLHMRGLAKRVSANNTQDNEVVKSERQSSKGKQVDRRF